MAKFGPRKSQNVEDDTSGKGDRLRSSLSNARQAANQALRNYYSETGQVSQTQRKNAKALGLQDSLIDITNQANKVQARLRRRFN